MRKVSPCIVWCVLLGVFALILGACIKPVDIGAFLDSDIVKEIIGEEEQPEPEPDPEPEPINDPEPDPEPGTSGGIEYEHPEDHAPQLWWSFNGVETRFNEGDMKTISISASDTIMIVVGEPMRYGGGVDWFCSDDQGNFNSPINSTYLSVRPDSNAFFSVEGVYHVVAVGTILGLPYSTGIFIKIIDE